MIVQIRAAGAVVGAPDEIDRARATFARSHALRLGGAIESGLWGGLAGRIEGADFSRRVHENVSPPAAHMRLGDTELEAQLHFLVHDRRLFDVVQEVTGCGRIGAFVGTVFRFVPGAGHKDAWHSDVDGNRLVAMSINFSQVAFDGGALEIRDAATRGLVYEGANRGRGDALLFAISPALEHRVAEVTGTTPRTVFAGWFCARPSFGERFRWARPRNQS